MSVSISVTLHSDISVYVCLRCMEWPVESKFTSTAGKPSASEYINQNNQPANPVYLFVNHQNHDPGNLSLPRQPKSFLNHLMSSRHLKRLEQQKSISADFDSSEDSEDEVINKQQTGARVNLFTALSDSEPALEEEPASVRSEPVEPKSPEPKKDQPVNKKKKQKAKKPLENWNAFSHQLEDANQDTEPLLQEPGEQQLFTINTDNLEESRDIRERIGSVSGVYLKRPAGRIIAPKKTWPKLPASALHFEIRKLQDDTTPQQLYKLFPDAVYNERYNELAVIIQSADPAAVSMHIHEHPFLIEGYLLMSDIIRSHSVADAAGYVELAVYLLEKALPASFSYLNARIDYASDAENRSIHLALFRHIQFLMRRASWTVALECAKILYQLDTKDPLLVILFIDYIFLHTENQREHDVVYAMLGNDPRYPFLVFSNNVLHGAKEFTLPPAASDIYFKHSITKETYEHAIFKLYFARTMPVWKQKTVKPCADSPLNQPDLPLDDQLPVYRHGILSDIKDIHLAYPTVATTSIDPFPPSTDGPFYTNTSNTSGLWTAMRRLFG